MEIALKKWSYDGRVFMKQLSIKPNFLDKILFINIVTEYIMFLSFFIEFFASRISNKSSLSLATKGGKKNEISKFYLALPNFYVDIGHKYSFNFILMFVFFSVLSR